MPFATLSAIAIRTLVSARAFDAAVQSVVRKNIFTAAKAQFRIPDEHRLRAEIDNTNNPAYGVLIRKKTGQAYPLNSEGIYVPNDATAVATPAAPPPRIRWYEMELFNNVDEIVSNQRIEDGIDLVPTAVFTDTDGHQIALHEGKMLMAISEREFGEG